MHLCLSPEFYREDVNTSRDNLPGERLNSQKVEGLKVFCLLRDVSCRPVDPSLYLHRFADRMGFGSKMHQVVNTALRLISSMKRDWLQTGRRPAGICGAALYIAGHIHGQKPFALRCVIVAQSFLSLLKAHNLCHGVVGGF